MKLCKDCRFCDTSQTFVDDPMIVGMFARCLHPSSAFHKIDLVTGADISFQSPCKHARSDPALCGKDGRYWEPLPDAPGFT